ncbi:thiamin biosynthesis protein ThiC, partial [Paenibacillus sp. HGF7]
MTKSTEIQEPNVSTFPGSRKVYVEGSRPDVRVAMREIQLSPSSGRFGEEENAPVRVYDTSGLYTDTEEATDIRRGLPSNRYGWIVERGDVE